MVINSQAYYWVFTINNPDDYDIPSGWVDVKYCVWQAEVGESGTEHLQGYVAFKAQKRLSALKKMCFEAHWELRRGTHQQAKGYCMKMDNPVDGPWEIGSDASIPKGPGARTDLDGLKNDMDSGMPLNQIAYNHTGLYLRYNRGVRDYLALQSKHREYKPGEKPSIFVLIGPSGCGKSSLVRQCFSNAYWLTKPNGNTQLWFDGYSGEEVIVFDEFYSWVPYDLLLRILDYYPLFLPFKGGMVKCGAKIFGFTSNVHFKEWYSKVDDKAPFYRRLSEFGSIYIYDSLFKGFLLNKVKHL